MKTFIAFVFISSSLLLSTAIYADQKYNTHSGWWETATRDSELHYNPIDGEWGYPSW